MEKLSDFDFVFDSRKILVRLGDKKRPAGPSKKVLEMIAREAGRARTWLDPAAVLEVIDYSQTNRHPIFDRAVKVGLAVCTIGPRLEQECAACFERNDLLRGMILDAIGSEAVIQVCRRAERALADRARALGLRPSKWYAPGFRSWEVEEQRFVFSKVAAAEIGVRLTDSCMMIPRKSGTFRVNFYADRALITRRS
ncbi:MAG TPA: hypothetical protein VGB72_07090 [Acidobacteriota bacterium]